MVVTGDIELNNSVGKVTLKNSTGDALLRMNEVIDDMNIETSTGDVNVIIKEEPANLEVDLSASTGDMTTNLELSYDRKSEHEIEGSKGSGGPEVYVHSSTGDISVVLD